MAAPFFDGSIIRSVPPVRYSAMFHSTPDSGIPARVRNEIAERAQRLALAALLACVSPLAVARDAWRGNEDEPNVIPEESPVGEPGTYDRVHNGETVMQTPKGTVSIRANQAGFMPLPGQARPRVLGRIPAFFRPTRNEGRFQGLHSRVQQQLEQRRQQRIQQIRERRKQAGLPREPHPRALQERATPADAEAAGKARSPAGA